MITLLIAAVLLADAPRNSIPDVGDPLPAFTAMDHLGRSRTWGDLRGPKGLVLVFFRSADW